MTNFLEIIHIESIRKQLLKQIEILDEKILTLNKSIKQKGLETKQGQRENIADIFKYRNELKSCELEFALLQRWLELVNSGVEPDAIDIEQLKFDVAEEAQKAQQSFEDQFLESEEVINKNEKMEKVSKRLGNQFFSPNLHPDYFKDDKSNEAQLRLNTTMSEPELVGSVFTDIFPKTLKQLLQSTELTAKQNLMIKSCLAKYLPFIETGNFTALELEEILSVIKSDEELKYIFKGQSELKPLLNTTLKEVILEIELPDGKPVTELREIIIRKRSEIAFLEKRLKSVEQVQSVKGQEEVLDINEQYFRKIQELKTQIEQLNLQIREKIRSMSDQKQKVADEALDSTRASLEKVFAESSLIISVDQGAIIIRNERRDMIASNFEAEQKEYKKKLMMLPSQIFNHLSKNNRIGNLLINNIFKNDKSGDSFWTLNHELMVSGSEISVYDKSNLSLNVILKIKQETVGIKIVESHFETEDFDMDFDPNSYSYKEIFNRIKTILMRDFYIDIDNLESKSELVETSPTNLVENQETLAREKYKQIQDICNKLEQKAKAGEFGKKHRGIFSISGEPRYNFKTFDIRFPENFDSTFSTTRINSTTTELQINHKLNFEAAYIVLSYKRNNAGNGFDNYDYFRNPHYQQPTVEQLSLFYDELNNLLIENGIEI
jgi:hypothetical protein